MKYRLPIHGRLGKMFVQSMEKHLCHDDVVIVINEQIPMVYPDQREKKNGKKSSVFCSH